ncbi:hypothetical protein B296_00053864 [Ensete ventricosum]|uniref:Uncharacterized protein n=1 Tax=Ensete ventricosum TaxID=4639 RepID=A0A426XHM3_ENSVE|nr:hypothetical protein B296_00053864 [Ensete ventricosum]
MRCDLTGSSQGDSPKELGSSLGTRREIARKKTEGLIARLPEVIRVCGTKAARRGGQPWPTPMQGRPPTARPRPRPAYKGRSPARVAARRGDACEHSGLWPAHKGGSRP